MKLEDIGFYTLSDARGRHYPCIIYLREWGDPIGELGAQTRIDRLRWAQEHDTHEDPICRKNCLDVCVDYNNKARSVLGNSFYLGEVLR